MRHVVRMKTPAVSTHTTDLGSAPLGPLMVRLSIPGMVSMLVMSLYNLVDTFWVSGLQNGTEAIAALTILFPVQMLAGAVGFGAAAGVTSLVSRRYGAADLDSVSLTAGHAVTLPIVLGSVLAAGCMLFGGGVARVLGASPALADATTAYLTIVAVGFPFQMLCVCMNGLYRGSGNTITPMLIMAAAAATNALLDPLLIYGWSIFPRLELRGAAVATVAAQVLSCLLALAYLRRQRLGYRLQLRHLRFHLDTVREIAQVGAPVTVETCMRSVVASLFNWVLSGYGSAAVAAQGLGWRVMMLVISCLGGGVHQALMPIVGYTFGARDYRRMWRAYGIAAIWTSAGGLLLGGIVCLAAPQILSPFAKDPELLRLGVLSLRLKLCTFFLVEPQMMAVFTLQGMGMGARAMTLTLSRNVILPVPALFILSSLFGVTGAYAAQATADVLTLFVAAWMLRRVYRMYPPQPATDTAATSPIGVVPTGLPE